MDLFQQLYAEHWEWVWGAVAFLASYIFPATRSIWIIVARALLTEKTFIRVFIWFGDKLVVSTKNSLDNTLWRPVKEALIRKLNG